jgi:hypothetical protein
MNVHVLPDRRLLDAETSLAALIARARSLQVFGPTVDFDAPVWDLSAAKIPGRQPPRSANCTLRASPLAKPAAWRGALSSSQRSAT